MDDLFTEIDLDADRARRAAEREAKGGSAGGLPIKMGGQVIATLPSEIPVDVFAPIRALDTELALVIRQSMEAARGAASQQATTDLVIDLLTQNPHLPSNAIDIVRDVAKALVGEESLDALMALRPTIGDVSALVKGVFRFYGLSVGESLPSSGSSTGGTGTGETDGETSNGTSSTTSDSTSEASTDAPAIPASSAPAGS